MEIPGDVPKLKKKRGFSGGSMQKSGKFSEISRKVTVKSIGNPGCSTTKRSILSTRGYNLFSEKKTFMFLLRIGRPFRGKFQFAQWSTSAPTFL